MTKQQIISELTYCGTRKTTNLHWKDEVAYITFPLFESPEIIHGFSTRIGGVSQGHFGTMNLSFSRGDKREAVIENHRRFARAVGYDETRLVCSDQVHKTEIRRVTKDDCGKGIIRESDIIATDGLVTNEPGIPLITYYADCVPLFFFDPVKKVVALAHAGWRGTVAGIGESMIRKMEEEYASKPEDILTAIGPSICKNCYEVSEDVASQFRDIFTAEESKYILFENNQGKYQLDLWKANEYSLLHAGITKDHLSVTNLCTCCNKTTLFSHRATNGKRGNLGAVIMLKE